MGRGRRGTARILKSCIRSWFYLAAELLPTPDILLSRYHIRYKTRMILYLVLNQSCHFLCGLRPPHPNPAIPARDPTHRRHSDPTLTLTPSLTSVRSLRTIQHQVSNRAQHQSSFLTRAVGRPKHTLRVEFVTERDGQKDGQKNTLQNHVLTVTPRYQ